MKILHINTFQEGGAALCAIRINKALMSQGIESRMLFAHGASLPKGVNGAIADKDRIVRLRSNPLFAKFRHLLMRMPWYMNVEKRQVRLDNVNTHHLFLHIPYSNYTNIVHHPLVEWVDIIHLHWVSDFVDYTTFFKNIKKPIIWTLHDKYPIVGVQHYCSEFTPVPDSLKKIDRECEIIKRNGILQSKKLHIVAISQLMYDLCSKSVVLNGIPCTIIHNGVDTKIFKPCNVKKLDILKRYKRESLLYINDNTKIFMFSSFGIWNKVKGLDRVIDALEQLEYKDKILVVVGDISKSYLPSASFPIVFTNLIGTSQELVEIYSIIDYFILASYEEAFAQTPLEAMACGKPVIATPCSGIPELIKPFNGIICNGYNSISIADGISKALNTSYDSGLIRQYIIENFEYEKIASQYIKLYEDVLKK